MENKPNKGVIFHNDRKNAETHPDWRGTINIETPGEKEISLWIKKDKNGKDYFSASISEPWKKPEPAEAPASDVYQRTGKYDKVPPPISEQEDIGNTSYDDSLPF